MPPFALTPKNRRWLWGILAFSLACQVVVCACLPLLHDTEARYAEIARKMIETGDWITPRHDAGDSAVYGDHVWFWGKPPLSFWLTAISMKCFGICEFAARLPGLLLEVGMFGLVYVWLKKMRDADFALLAVVVLATTAQCFICFESVMTDGSLTFCSTLSLVSFWMALHAESPGSRRRWGWAFFVGLGFGLLAKGPLAGALVLFPLLPWVFWKKRFGDAWRALPWVGGSLLTLAIAVPWYAAAELKTPGFFNYFVLGEHFGRFFNPGWTGDRYGHAHMEPRGKIWLFFLTAAIPWTPVLLLKMIGNAKGWRQWFRDEDGSLAFLAACSFALIVVLTVARNIIWPYSLPAMPFAAALVVEMWRRMPQSRPRIRHVVWVAAVVPVAMLVFGSTASVWSPLKPSKSGRDTVGAYLADRASPSDRLYTYGYRSFSVDFYSSGTSRVVEGTKPTQRTTLDELPHAGGTDYVLFPMRAWEALPEATRDRFVEVRRFHELDMSRRPFQALRQGTLPVEKQPSILLVKTAGRPAAH